MCESQHRFFLFPKNLGHVVLGAFASLWYLPVDVLLGSLDITCLAVNAAGFDVSHSSTRKKGKKKEKMAPLTSVN